MSKRPTPQEIRDHYRPNVEALSTSDLLRLVRGGVEKNTPQYIKKELERLANDEAQSRGIEFPTFTAYFSA
jgi:hypothetical protein